MSKLVTKNLTLKVRSLADVDALTMLCTKESPDRDAVVKKVFFSETHWRKNGFGDWSIYLKDKLIGTISLKRDPKGTVNLEVEIAESYRQKGYGKEAVKAVLDFVFKLHKIPKVIATVKSLDTTSLIFLKSLGFKEGDVQENNLTFCLENPIKK